MAARGSFWSNLLGILFFHGKHIGRRFELSYKFLYSIHWTPFKEIQPLQKNFIQDCGTCSKVADLVLSYHGSDVVETITSTTITTFNHRYEDGAFVKDEAKTWKFTVNTGNLKIFRRRIFYLNSSKTISDISLLQFRQIPSVSVIVCTFVSKNAVNSNQVELLELHQTISIERSKRRDIRNLPLTRQTGNWRPSPSGLKKTVVETPLKTKTESKASITAH